VMQNVKSKWFGLSAIAIGLLSGVPTADAMTLFQEQLTGSPQTLQWVSPFTGRITLETDLISYGANSFTMEILQDGKFLDGLNLVASTPSVLNQTSGVQKKVGSYLPLEVKKGSLIEFAVTSSNGNINSNIDFTATIDFPSSLVFLHPNEKPTFNHVGLLQDGLIYESSPAYQGGNYWDLINGDNRAIAPDSGVQKEHTLGSFLHLSPSSESSPIKQYEIIEIETSLADKMEAFIATELERGYASVPNHWNFLPPDYQKGYYGKYNGVGLIERAAESVGEFKNGDGFVPKYKEFVYINNIFGGPAIKETPWECLNIFPASVECQSNYSSKFQNGIVVSLLSPALMHYFATQTDSALSDRWLQGKFDLLDFILTDPLGRRLGYTEELGFLNEIPDAFYTGQGAEEQFFIPDRFPGEYKLQFFGLCNESAKAIIGDHENGTLISGCPPEPPDDRESVPEPSTWLGLILLGGFFAKLKKIR
jgi:hypothetical protein